MILQYQNELIALAAIFILLLLYLFIKNKTKPEIKVQTDTKSQKEEEQTKIQPSIDTVQKTEKVEAEEVKTEQASKEQASINRTILKNSVPNHGKITKDDFKIFTGDRILLAEDNLINQKVILGVLADSGIDVVVANDGQEALDILQTDTDFVIILMDVHMPRVDGFKATRTIRQNPAYNHITVVALSGDTASDDIKKMKEAGMDEHLEKPLKVDDLYDILYQYSNKVTSKQQEQEEVSSSDLITLDTQRGLEISGNDANFYHDILKEFLTLYSNSAQELEILLKNNKKDQADKLLLDIIGVSANIGADALTECANNIKSSIPANKKIDLNTYDKKMQELVKNINNYLLTCN